MNHKCSLQSIYKSTKRLKIAEPYLGLPSLSEPCTTNQTLPLIEVVVRWLKKKGCTFMHLSRVWCLQYDPDSLAMPFASSLLPSRAARTRILGPKTPGLSTWTTLLTASLGLMGCRCNGLKMDSGWVQDCSVILDLYDLCSSSMSGTFNL